METNITVTDKDLWATAHYREHYHLIVVDGQDSGDGYYYDGEIVDTVVANTPEVGSNMVFDHWDDPMDVVVDVYNPSSRIIMKDTVARIVAIFTSNENRGNSVAITGDDLDTDSIIRGTTTVINGRLDIGAVIFDGEGSIGTIVEINPDNDESTDDFGTEKLFYGGNV